MNPIRIGTRGSQLALWQAEHIAAQLRAAGHAVAVEVIRTTGDRMQNPAANESLSPNGTGIFIKEIEDALLAGRIDLAVHSLKDLPTQTTPGLALAAIPPRADARDAFICEDHWALHMLPSGARIGTTSPRRQAMLLALRPDVTFVELRGNVDTRLRKWSEGACDALVLASAGLDRLNRTEHVHQRFAVDEMTPAPGQGALALQVRSPEASAFLSVIPEGNLLSNDAGAASDAGMALDAVTALKGTGSSPSTSNATDRVPQGFSLGSHSAQEKEGVLTPGDPARDRTIHAIVHALNCADTAFAVTAERAALHALGGGCQLPLGAYAHRVDDHWHMHAMVVSPDGEQAAHITHKAPLSTPAETLGQTVAESLIARGALDLLHGGGGVPT